MEPAEKYKNICLEIVRDGCYLAPRQTLQEFYNMLSVNGEHISVVTLVQGYDFIFEALHRYCKNLRELTFTYSGEGPLRLQNFKNLKVLKSVSGFRNIEEWTDGFRNNPNIEIVACYDTANNGNFIELLDMLPNLKGLEMSMEDDFHLIQPFQHLLRLDRLTKFSLYSSSNCEQILFKLAGKLLNLVELDVH